MKQLLFPIIVAGGSGTRMKSEKPKQFLELLNKPVLLWSIECFDSLSETAEIIVVLPKRWHEEARAVLEKNTTKHNVIYTIGGARRQDSVAAGLACVPDETAWVAVHDGARPAVTPKLVQNCFEIALNKGNASCAIPLVDTLVEASDGMIVGDLDRSRIYAMQTPQIFRADLLRKALSSAEKDGIEATDDAGLVRRLGITVFLAPGSPFNIKLTKPDDMPLLEFILKQTTAVGKNCLLQPL